MLNTQPLLTTNFSDSIARFFGNGVQSTNGTRNLRKSMRVAYKEFSKTDGIWVDSLFDMHFLTQHGEATVADYLNGSTSRHQSAVELANAYEEHLMPANAKMRKVLRAEAASAADRYLSYLPAQRFRQKLALQAGPSDENGGPVFALC